MLEVAEPLVELDSQYIKQDRVNGLLWHNGKEANQNRELTMIPIEKSNPSEVEKICFIA